ncbi:unnamed protein product [Toxocara canis]|uniref:Ig-like domain-containing protein n=1 Tax=Toxocara canis TaxID=6265 RepID=A0A183VFP9_TOXCA|nr:unnamed protein product [Toxocara canis]
MVTVLTKPHIGEQIDQNPRVVQNHDIVLHCPARGNPKPTIYWLFNGAYVQGNRYSTVGDGDLKISSAQENDAGRYTCFAQNEAGSLSTDYELEVIGPPRFHREGDAVYEVKVDDSITMDCAVDAEPRPEIIWYRGDSPLYLSDNIHISSDGQASELSSYKTASCTLKAPYSDIACSGVDLGFRGSYSNMLHIEGLTLNWFLYQH